MYLKEYVNSIFRLFLFLGSENVAASRHRRDVDDESQSFQNINKLKEFIQKEANLTLRKDVEKIVQDLLYNLPLQQLCKMAPRCQGISFFYQDSLYQAKNYTFHVLLCSFMFF